jgi:hypothetical protein
MRKDAERWTPVVTAAKIMAMDRPRHHGKPRLEKGRRKFLAAQLSLSALCEAAEEAVVLSAAGCTKDHGISGAKGRNGRPAYRCAVPRRHQAPNHRD